MHSPRQSRWPSPSTTQSTVVFCETSRPTYLVMMISHPANRAHYARTAVTGMLITRPRLPDVHTWHLADMTMAFADVRFRLECVAKLFAKLRTSNYRIRLNGVLNRCCAFGLILESILLILVVKIVLQHIRL